MLLGSISRCCLANIIGSFVTTISQCAFFRFIAAVGLADELGVGITLVSKLTSEEIRSVVTSFVAAVGLFGAVAAHTQNNLFRGAIVSFLEVV